MSEEELFWVLLLAELGILVIPNMQTLLAAGVIAGTIYLGSKKGLI